MTTALVVFILFFILISIMADSVKQSPRANVSTYNEKDKLKNESEIEVDNVEFVEDEKIQKPTSGESLGNEVEISMGKVLGRRILVQHQYTYTVYYITFELENGNRIELKVNGVTYGLIIEGDVGEIRYKSGELIKFNRRID